MRDFIVEPGLACRISTRVFHLTEQDEYQETIEREENIIHNYQISVAEPNWKEKESHELAPKTREI